MAYERLYGLLAEFDNPDDLFHAARTVREKGYRYLDAYSPMPVHGLSEAVGFRHTWLPLVVLIGGLAGAAGGFFLQYWITVLHYPLNIGGRPLNSWPAYIPITFECGVLVAAITAVLAMIALNGLPRPYHPLFNAPRFALASHHRFFLCIEKRDPLFDPAKTRDLLESFHTRGVCEVPA